AEDQVFNQGRVNAAAIHKTAHHLGCQMIRPYACQLPLEGGSKWGAHVVSDDNIFHGWDPLSVFCSAFSATRYPPSFRFSASSATRSLREGLPIRVLGRDSRTSMAFGHSIAL